jgi:hypothetical protein
VEQRYVIALEVVVGVRLPVARESSSHPSDGDERLQVVGVARGSERCDGTLERLRLFAEVDEHEAPPRREVDRHQ